MATKTRHYFYEKVSSIGDGEILQLHDKNTNMVLALAVIPDGTTQASAAAVSFYGKPIGSDSFISLQAMDAVDSYKFVSAGSLNHTYYIDILNYSQIKVTLTSVTGGSVSVVGELID